MEVVFRSCPTYRLSTNVYIERRGVRVLVGSIEPYCGVYRFVAHSNLNSLRYGLGCSELEKISTRVTLANDSQRAA